MAYYQAYELLKDPNCTVSDLVDLIEEVSMEYGYILGKVEAGHRINSEADLVRILVLLKLLKEKIICLT